jgi:hypothetical protein
MFGAACGGDDSVESNSSASAQDVDAINARIQRNEMITALLGVGALPLHDIDEELASGGELPDNAIPSMRTVIRLTSLTEWDSDLQSRANEVRAAAESFITAAEADDHGGAAEAATAVHDGWHDLSEHAWDLIAPATGGESDAPSGDETPHDDGDDDHDDETPEATP